jgi:hypothetical protein
VYVPRILNFRRAGSVAILPTRLTGYTFRALPVVGPNRSV